MRLEPAIDHLQRSVRGLIAIYHFGSHATGQARPESDVDLAILAREPLTDTGRFALAQELAVMLHRDVDLVDLRAASGVMRMQVLSSGTCLVDRDPVTRQEFEMYAYADYARLNEERHEIIKGIRQRGTVYD